MSFVYFKCKECEKREPKNPKNILSSRKLIRSHLRIIHGLKYDLPKLMNSAKKSAWKDDNGKPKYYERIIVE